jgi:hypothetical protein
MISCLTGFRSDVEVSLKRSLQLPHGVLSENGMPRQGRKKSGYYRTSLRGIKKAEYLGLKWVVCRLLVAYHSSIDIAQITKLRRVHIRPVSAQV